MNFRIQTFIAIFIVILLLPVKDINPQGYGITTVKKWADDRKSAFSFTFDDACMSQYTYAAPVLESFNFRGTFFVITNRLTDNLPANYPYGTWTQFRSMAVKGHEIGSHTVTHADLPFIPVGTISTPGTLMYELYQSKHTIELKITSQKCITIAYPYQDYSDTVIMKEAAYYEAARKGSFYPIDSSITGTDFYAIGAYEESFTTPRTSSSDDLDELLDMDNYLQSSITDGKWGMLEAHEVVPFVQIPDLVAQGEWYPMSTEWLTSLCTWLKQKSDSNLVWVATMGNVVRYMKEREQFHYTIRSQTATSIQINVTDNLVNTIYNYPLTIDITVPPDWQAAIIVQSTRRDTTNTFLAGGSTYIRAHVIPDGGYITLSKTNPILPVELTSFTAAVINKGIHLNWKTETEINNNSFDIERMTGNNTWKNIGSLPGSGNSNSPKAYSFIDNSPLSTGKYSYRLKQIDNDGNYKYSSIVEVEINSVPEVYSLDQNYPNPFNPSTRIKYSIPFESNVRLIIFNSLGEVVKELTNEMQGTGTYEVGFNSSGISSGVYFYSILANSTDGKQSFRETKKMILMK